PDPSRRGGARVCRRARTASRDAWRARLVCAPHLARVATSGKESRMWTAQPSACFDLLSAIATRLAWPSNLESVRCARSPARLLDCEPRVGAAGAHARSGADRAVGEARWIRRG